MHGAKESLEPPSIPITGAGSPFSVESEFVNFFWWLEKASLVQIEDAWETRSIIDPQTAVTGAPIGCG